MFNKNTDDGLQEPFIKEDLNSQENITSMVETPVASMQTRMASSGKDYYPLFPTPKLEIAKEYDIDLSPWVNRPFLIGRAVWSSTNNRFDRLATSSNNSGTLFSLPRDAFLSNTSLSSLIGLARLFRCKMCVNITLTGTLTHSGLLLAAAMPPAPDGIVNTDKGRIINTLLSGPHAFLAANEANTVCLEVPFYCNTDYATLDVGISNVYPTPDFTNKNANFATLVLMVLNPLQAPDGSSTTLSVVIEAVFKELDLKVPYPRSVVWNAAQPTSLTDKVGQSFLAKAGTKFIDNTFALGKNLVIDGLDALRGTVRRYTGLHNSNIASLDERMITTTRNYFNCVDSTTRIEKLDPYSCVDRIVQEPTFQTTVDEMSISNIISKPQYIGTFSVSTTLNAGALLFAGPICPYQGGSTNSLVIANNIELMYHLTRAWRGDITLHIQSSMNNKQNVKLKVIKLYAPPEDVTTKYPSMATAINAPSDLLEFSQGNQVLDVSLPFNSRNSLVYNTRDLQLVPSLLVGQYYIYLAQPMVVGDSSPLTCEFNVYMSCDSNFTFYGYSTELGLPQRAYVPPVAPAHAPNPPPVPTVPKLEPPKNKFQQEKQKKVGQSATVMNKPSLPSSLLQHGSNQEYLDDSRLVPLVDIRPLIRRFQFNSSGSVTLDAVTGLYNLTIPLETFIGEAFDNHYGSSVKIIPHMFYGKQCGLKFKLVLSGTSYVNVSFIPPNVTADISANSELQKATVNTALPGYWYNLPPGNIRPGMYPVNQQEYPSSFVIGNLESADSNVMGEYEFEIPNTTIFNFIGSALKMSPINPTFTTSGGDIGTLVITFYGPPSKVIEYALFNAFTDESRLGFQVLAPVVTLPSADGRLLTPYSDYGRNNPLLSPTNKFVYFTNLNTTFNTG